MKKLLFTFALFFVCILEVNAAKPLQAPAKCDLCEYGCVHTGKCLCKNCNEHTDDPKFLHAHKPPQAPTKYQTAIDMAKESGTPLVTFVGCPSEVVPGFIVTHASVAEFDNHYAQGSAVISIFENGKHYAYAVILDPTAEKIIASKPHKVSVCENGHCRLTFFPPTTPVQSFSPYTQSNTYFGNGGCANGQCGQSQQMQYNQMPIQTFGSGGCANGRCGN